jgi:hypothetical protein
MKLKIFTTVTNQPPFAELQAQTFKKFVDSDYEFHLIDDSLNFSEQYIKICEDNYIFYHKKEEKIVPHHPMAACAFAVQWTYDNLIKKCEDDIVLFLDSDMFLLEKFDIIKYMQDKTILGSYQKRGHVEYLWNGILLFNMPKILSLKENLNFSCGMIDGEFCDVGGGTYYFLKENNIRISDISLQYNYYGNDYYRGCEVENMESFIDGKFLHFRGGTLWDGNADVYERKLKMLQNILSTL